MLKIDRLALRFLLLGSAAILIALPTLYGLFSAQQHQIDLRFGEGLSQRLAIDSTEAILADDELALNATLASYEQLEKIAGASFINSALEVVSASGDLDGIPVASPVIISGDEYGQVTLYVKPATKVISILSLLIISAVMVALSVAGYFSTIRQQPKLTVEPDSGTLVTLELGDLPGLADQLSTHTINNLYGELQNQVEALFDSLGGQLYLAQGPVLRGLFFSADHSQRATTAALMLKRLTNHWAAEQGVSINRRIAVQDAPSLNLNGSLINNHRRAQLNRNTGMLLKSGQPGDIIFGQQTGVNLPNGLTYREHPSLRIVSQFSPPIEHTLDLEVNKLIQSLANPETL
ncbi:hypothetical protein [uncultured Umboniibacter sp.]|uniref:hypothetical protein n=1 Tax=uncultured Umboniibacter sp. TaxID=1798917 RepID=UPI002638491A|nr:hypothetical protein [uncultured Umboniibacter sp.]